MSVTECQECGTAVEQPYTLCPACELSAAMLLLRYVPWVHALEDSLDATVHPGGHQPTRIITPTAPTPIRLDVLDHLDLLASTAQGLWRRLMGVDVLDWKRDLCPDVIGCLTDSAAHLRLAMLPDIGMYVAQFRLLRARTLEIIDVPERRTPIGQCLTCGIAITAADGQEHVTCPTCGSEQTASAVRLDLLRRSIRSGRMFTAGECARLLQDCGYRISRKTITSWRTRGLIEPSGRDAAGRPVYSMASVVSRLRCDTPND